MFARPSTLAAGFSHLLYTKRNERVDQKTVFASLGLSAAISVQQFNAFDVGKNGYLTFSELVRMFESDVQVRSPQGMLVNDMSP